MHSMEKHNIPFAISENYDWIAVPGHVGWVQATVVVDSVEEAILEDWTGWQLEVMWRKGWVQMVDNPYIDTALYWTECREGDERAEPAMIWKNLFNDDWGDLR